MKERLLQFFLLFLIAFSSFSQSTLITPGNKGNIKVPNLTYSQIIAIQSPETGMVAYDISYNCLRVYNGTQWICSFQDTGVNKIAGSAKRFGGTGYDEATNVITDSNGNVYVSVNTSVNTTRMWGDLALMKLDPNLNIIWSKTIPNAYTTGLCLDSQNRVCIAGTFAGTLAIGSTTLNSSGSNDVFVARFRASDGGFVWASSTGSSELDYVTGLTVDMYDNLYMTSVWNSSFITYSGNTAITKYDTNGNQVFNMTNAVSGPSSRGKVYGDSEGNMYITGSYFTRVIIGGISLEQSPYQNPYNYYVAKINSNGNVFWVKTSQHHLQDMVFDSSTNNIYIIGELFGQMIYNYNTFNSTGGTDIFVGKLDINGDIVWMKQIGGQNGYEVRGGNAITLDSEKNVYITGYFGRYEGTTTIQFGATTLPSIYNQDGYVAKYNSNGEPEWIERFAGTSDETGEKLTVAPNGNIYVVGRFNGETRFQFAPTNVNFITSSGSYDAFIAIYRPFR